MVNMNELARAVTLEEGKKRSVNIAQVKEVMRITFRRLAAEDPAEVIRMIRRVG